MAPIKVRPSPGRVLLVWMPKAQIQTKSRFAQVEGHHQRVVDKCRPRYTGGKPCLCNLVTWIAHVYIVNGTAKKRAGHLRNFTKTRCVIIYIMPKKTTFVTKPHLIGSFCNKMFCVPSWSLSQIQTSPPGGSGSSGRPTKSPTISTSSKRQRNGKAKARTRPWFILPAKTRENEPMGTIGQRCMNTVFRRGGVPPT